jgi:uncharacterized protein YndB with AHSA1/START domain
VDSPEPRRSEPLRSPTTIQSDPPTDPVFSFFTRAAPARVWHALTDPAHTRIYLDGMALQSDWVVGSAIFAPFRGEPTQLGEVLCVHVHHRLSYVIRPPEASAVYLTWLLRPQEEGCICRLQIDEADTSDIAELEDVWLPILAGLQRGLDAVPDQRLKSEKPEAIN